MSLSSFLFIDILLVIFFVIVAGADVLITNTYQASIKGFMEHLGLTENESYDLIKSAVKLAKQAVLKYTEEENQHKRGVLFLYLLF